MMSTPKLPHTTSTDRSTKVSTLVGETDSLLTCRVQGLNIQSLTKFD